VTTATAGDVTKPVAGPQPAAPNAEVAPVRSVQAPAAVSPPDGTLALAVSPWGEVFVNGTSRGVAPPLSQLSLAPGSYTIEIRNSDNVRFTTRIDVKSGQTVSLHHRF
jgi:serine/threonine-protein kinase